MPKLGVFDFRKCWSTNDLFNHFLFETAGLSDAAYEMNNGDLESNGDPDTTGDGHLFVPGNVNADIGKSLDCLLLENDSKLGD